LLDTGASRSAFPLSVARDLGISDQLGVASPLNIPGQGGKTAECWTAPHSVIHAQVIADLAGGPVLFGPRVPINPLFIQDERWFVLGRDDFFRAFTVTFPKPQGAKTRRFVLEYPD
jgi:hypothetical protein